MPKGIPRDQSVQRRILHRLKIAHGHLSRVIQMAEANEYCIDVINQSVAVQKALRQVDNLILENHLKTCVTEGIKKGKDSSRAEADKEVKEIISVFRKIS